MTKHINSKENNLEDTQTPSNPSASAKKTLTLEEAANILAILAPFSSSEEAMETMSRRGLNGSTFPTSVLGIAPSTSELRKLGLSFWLANRIAGKMLTSLFNHVGDVVAFRARRCDGKGIRLRDGRRIKSVGIGPSSCAVMATTGGLAVLRGAPIPENSVAVIGEGEGDLWLWQMLNPDSIYFGSVSGSSSDKIAERLKSAKHIILRHHPDSAGDALAEKWGFYFEDHSKHCKLWRLGYLACNLDDGESWQKGVFKSTNFFNSCFYYFPPKKKDPQAEYDERRAQILSAASKFPSSHHNLHLLQRYTACIDSSIENMRSHCAKGGRAVAIHRYSYGVAGLCAGAEEVLDVSDSSSLVSNARDFLESAAISMMGAHGRREALSQVKSGWNKGFYLPIVLEDDWIEPTHLNRFIKKNKVSKKATKVKSTDSTEASAEEIPVEEKKMSLAQVREALDQTVLDAINRKGIQAIIAPCGAGKSYSTKKNLVAHLKDKRGTHRAIMSLPTKDLGAEIAKGFEVESEEQAADLNVLQAITRTLDNCANFGIVSESNSILAAGGSEFCRKTCRFGWGQWSAESNEGAETPCAWAQANRDVEGSDLLINTHALEMKRDALSRDEDAKITIDWKSFDHIAEQGFDAKPLVIRGHSFSIRATVAEEGEGSPVPTAELEPKSSLTAQSKLEILTWFLDYYKKEIPEGQENDEKILRSLLNDLARDLTGVGEETRVFVRWNFIADQHIQGGLAPLACPTVEICNEGWLSGIHLSVRLEDEDSASPLPEMKINHRMTRTDHSRQDIVRWVANAWDVEDNRDALKDAAVSRVNLYPIDVTIFDESVWQQVAKGAEATHAQISECIATGEISEGGSKLLRLMRQCRDEERDMFSAEILTNIPVDSISLDPGRGGRAALAGLKPSNTQEQHLEALAEIIPWVVPEGIHRSLDHNWKGVMITKRGTLAVSWVQPIETRHCRSTICLDATATPEIIRACFGGLDVEITKLEMERPEGLKVIWIPLDTGTSANCFNGHSKKALLELIAVHKEYGGEGSLVISHKTHVAAGEGVFSLIQEDGSEVLHHNGTLARGSNRFEDLSTAIIHDYHAPSGAIRVQAEALAIALEQDSDDPETRRRLEKEVRFQLEIAPARQATQRTRASLASLENPQTLVFVSSTSPARLGYDPDLVVDQQHLVRKHFGLTPVRTREMLLQDILDRSEGGYMPTLAVSQPGDFALGDLIPNSTYTAVESDVKTLGKVLHIDLKVDQDRSASHRLMSWNKRYFKGNWESMFNWTMINVAMIETSAGGQASPYLYRGDLDRAEIAKWMTCRKITWWRVRGDKEVTVVEHDDRILHLLSKIPEAHFRSSTIGNLLYFLGLGLKITGRAVRTRLDHLRLEGESMRECLTKLWIAAQMKVNAAEVERQMIEDEKTFDEALEGSKRVALARPMPWHLKEIAAGLGTDESEPAWVEAYRRRTC